MNELLFSYDGARLRYAGVGGSKSIVESCWMLLESRFDRRTHPIAIKGGGACPPEGIWSLLIQAATSALMRSMPWFTWAGMREPCANTESFTIRTVGFLDSSKATGCPGQKSASRARSRLFMSKISSSGSPIIIADSRRAPLVTYLQEECCVTACKRLQGGLQTTGTVLLSLTGQPATSYRCAPEIPTHVQAFVVPV